MGDREFRAAFIQTLQQLHLEPSQSIALAEQLTARLFAACGPRELSEVLLRVRDLLVDHVRTQRVGANRPNFCQQIGLGRRHRGS
jgi:hypothetical protein